MLDELDSKPGAEEAIDRARQESAEEVRCLSSEAPDPAEARTILGALGYGHELSDRERHHLDAAHAYAYHRRPARRRRSPRRADRRIPP